MARKKDDKQTLAMPKEKPSLDEILKSMRAEFGNDMISVCDTGYIVPMPRTSTGITSLDIITGGGWPDGRIIEVYGPESSGKTTITLHSIKAAQEAGKICAYIDAEHAFDIVYAKNVGVDVSQLLIAVPEYGEQAMDMAENLVRSGGVGLIVVDSVAALVPKKELDGDFGDANVGLHARLMSQAMRKLTGPAQTMGCTIIFINQIREKVGVMYGSPETTTGGRALKFYSSIRLDVRKRDALKDGKDIYANRTEVKTVKNKTFPPFKSAFFDIIFGEGVDNIGSVIDLGVDFGIVQKGGAYYTYADHRFQGKAKLVAFFKSPEGAELFKQLDKEVQDTLSQNSAEMMNLSAEELDKTKRRLDKESELDAAIADGLEDSEEKH